MLIRQVTRHTFGLVQSKLFPVYFYCVLGSNFVSLAVYAVYHPRELLDWHESVQVKYHTLLGMKKLSTFDWKKEKIKHFVSESSSSCKLSLFIFQMLLFFVALITAGLNAQWFGPETTELMFLMREIEKEHNLGEEIGLGSQKEAYAKLKEQDPKYKAYRSKFGSYHGLSSLCNLIGFLCTTTNLVYTALNLATI